jgi:DNA invertase Pin-like site-specific DNA recombinase
MPKISREELIKLQKLLVSDVAIAKHLGVSQPYVHHIRKIYGIPSRFAENAQRNNEIAALYLSGMKASDIAKRFGLRPGRVYQITGDAGARKEKTRKKVFSENHEQIIQLYGKGIPGTAIANEFGISFNSVYKIIRAARAEKQTAAVLAYPTP